MMRKIERLPNQREMIILAILASKERFGAELIALYEKRARRSLPRGSVYVVLARMEEKRLVRSRVGTSNPKAGGNHRRFFRIAPAGARALGAMRRLMSQLKRLK